MVHRPQRRRIVLVGHPLQGRCGRARAGVHLRQPRAQGDAELVRWGYTFEEEGEATKVSETWRVLPAYPGFVLAMAPDADVKARLDGMARTARDGIAATLANLKRIAES